MLVARCFLLVLRYFLLVTFCSLLVFFLSKLLWTANAFLTNFWDFRNFFWIVVFKVFSTCKTIFEVDIKLQILPELIPLWCLDNNIWTHVFIYFYVLEESKAVAWKSPIKKVFLNIPQKFTGKHLSWGLFSNKAADWKPVTSLNTETGTGPFLWIFWNLYKNIYFTNA